MLTEREQDILKIIRKDPMIKQQELILKMLLLNTLLLLVIVLEVLFGDTNMDLQQLKKILDLALPYDNIDIRFNAGNYPIGNPEDTIRIVYTTEEPLIAHVISIFYDLSLERLLAISSNPELPSWFTNIFTATQYCSDSNVYIISLKE